MFLDGFLVWFGVVLRVFFRRVLSFDDYSSFCRGVGVRVVCVFEVEGSRMRLYWFNGFVKFVFLDSVAVVVGR